MAPRLAHDHILTYARLPPVFRHSPRSLPRSPDPLAVRRLYETALLSSRDRETREKAQQNAEGVGFEPTESLRPQRFSRWRTALANPSNFACSRTLSEFVVPARPASSRLVSTRWLYAWLYKKRAAVA